MSESLTTTVPRKPFDLAVCDLLAPSDEGRPFTIAHTYDRLGFPMGRPYLGSDGKPVTITLRGQNSAVGRATLKQLRDELAALEGNGQKITQENRDQHNTTYLVAMTRGWTIEQLDGEPFLVNPVNVEKLWTDKRFEWLREPAMSFIARDANFLAPPDDA